MPASSGLKACKRESRRAAMEASNVDAAAIASVSAGVWTLTETFRYNRSPPMCSARIHACEVGKQHVGERLSLQEAAC